MRKSYSQGSSRQLQPAAHRNDLPMQRMEGMEEEEPLQGKFHPLQMMEAEEEELMQGRFDTLQRQEVPEEEELMQGKFDTTQRQEVPEEEELMQGKFTPPAQGYLPASQNAGVVQHAKAVPPPFTPVQRQTNDTGMPDGVKSQMESAFQTDFSGVKIHNNSSKAPEVGALAYTQGSDVHFAPGQFKPESPKGQELLGHELTHVVQQRENRVQPTTEVAGMPVNDDVKLESEADKMGRFAAGS